MPRLKERQLKKTSISHYYDQCNTNIALPDYYFDQTTLLVRMSFGEISLQEQYHFILDKSSLPFLSTESKFSCKILGSEVTRARRLTRHLDSPLHVSAVQTLSSFSFEPLPYFDHHQKMESCARQFPSLNLEH